MNTFEQVSRDGHQMSLSGENRGPCAIRLNASRVMVTWVTTHPPGKVIFPLVYVCLSTERAVKIKTILVSIGKFSTGQPQLIQALLIQRND